MRGINSFFTHFLLGTPTASDKKRGRAATGGDDNNDISDHQNKSGNNDDEDVDSDHNRKPSSSMPPIPPRVPLPVPHRSFARASSTTRARSLSRVYNQVPRDRPDFRAAQQDVIEYYAHLAMIENDPDRVQEEDGHLREALHGCVVRKYGRLYSRLQIASLCISIGALRTDADQQHRESEEGAGGVGEPPEFVASEIWKSLYEQLMIVKSYMLRKDADTYVPIQRLGYEDEDLAAEKDELDGTLEKHEMFQESYREVLSLLQVQQILSRFCEQIKDTVNLGGVGVSSKHLASVVDSYRDSLHSLFMPEDMSEDARIAQETKSPIPEELTRFLLHELRKKPAESVGLLLKDAVAVMRNPEGVFSYIQLKHKMKAVLTKWSESILEVPKLVELGYGGVMAPIFTGDEDDVSSYGVDEDRLLSQKPAEDLENAVGATVESINTDPIPFRNSRNGRRTSFADELLRPDSRSLPSKSPRWKRNDTRSNLKKKSPPRSPPRATVVGENGKKNDRDDDSHTEDPTETIHQFGGALDRLGSPADLVPRDTMPNRDIDTPRKRRRISPTHDVDDLWEDDPEAPLGPKRRVYRDWTADETSAVIEGYRKFGRNWKMVKHNCMHRLSRRTTVQIKDKWRTLVQNGELEE